MEAIECRVADAALRPELEPLPGRLAHLPVRRGYPVPWFVAWVGPDGKACDAAEPGAAPEFRCMDGAKWRLAVARRLCWVCGEEIDRRLMTFVVGPMCGINRTSSEPPCHPVCAAWSARNCPFLSRPQMTRREADLPTDLAPSSGVPILRNPGVTLLWTTHGYHLFPDGRGGTLIRLSNPDRVEWYAEGKPAARAAVARSVETGLPLLVQMAEAQDRARPGAGAVAELRRRAAAFEAFYPAKAE